MSNSGSGNQGIAATMPVVVVADYLNVGEEKRLRALFLSHLMAIYIHSKLPKLSALCAVTTASMGKLCGHRLFAYGQIRNGEHGNLQQMVTSAESSAMGHPIAVR